MSTVQATKVLVLCGPESSGKSWLSGVIQAHFGGLVVAEYVRHFIEQERRDTCYADIPSIARGQLAWEDQAREQALPLLILDTHLLSNMLWSHALFGDCPAWLEQALLARHYDLHLLLSPQGVEWVADGQRSQPVTVSHQAWAAWVSLESSVPSSQNGSLSLIKRPPLSGSAAEESPAR